MRHLTGWLFPHSLLGAVKKRGFCLFYSTKDPIKQTAVVVEHNRLGMKQLAFRCRKSHYCDKKEEKYNGNITFA